MSAGESRESQTKLQELQAELEKTKTCLQEAQQRGQIACWERKIGSDHVDCTGVMFDLLGIDPEEINRDHGAIMSHFHPDDRPELERALNDALSGKSDFSLKVRHSRGGEEWAYLEASGRRYYDRNGTLVSILGTLRDVSDTVIAGSDLEKERRYTDRLIQSANVMIIGLDPDGRTTDFNPAAERLTGYTKSELVDRDWLRVLVPPDRYEWVYRELGFEFANGLPREFECPILTKDGEERIISWCNNQIYDGGQPVATISFGLDITESRRIADELQTSEERFRTLFNASLDLIMVTPLNENFEQMPYAEVNQRASEVLGYSIEELATMEPNQLIDPDVPRDVERVRRLLREKGNHMFERVVRTKDGRRLDLEVNAHVFRLKGQTMILSVSRDITERKKTERALRESEARLRSIVEHSSNLFFTHTIDHQITYISPQTRQFFDCEPEVAMKHWTEFLTDNPINEIGIANTQRAIETGKRQPPYELEARGVKGREIWVEVHEAPVVENGKTVAITGALIDITQRKKAEKEAQRLKEFYQTVLENVHDGILVTDKHSRIAYINRAMTEMDGVAKEAFIGKSVINDFPEDVIGHRIANYLKVKETLQPLQYEIEGSTLAGQTIVRSGWLVPKVSNGEFDGMIITVQDVTERKRIERDLQRSEQRMKSILESTSDIILSQDLEGRYTYYNGPSEYGLNPNDVIGRTPSEFHTGDILERIELNRRKAIETRDSVQVETAMMWDGQPQWFLDVISPVIDNSGEVAGTTQISINITQRKKAEQELRMVFDLSSDLICIADAATNKYTRVNPSFKRLLGYEESEIVGREFMEFVHPDDHAITIEASRRFAKRGQPIRRLENRLICKDGSFRWIEWHTFPVKERGQTFAVGHDVTERKRTLEALRESEEKYRLLYDNAGVYITVWDYNGVCRHMNRPFAEIFGPQNDVSVGSSLLEIFPIEGEGYLRLIRGVIDTGKPRRVEYRADFPTGERCFLLNIHPVLRETSEESVVQIVSHDITERTRAEAALAASEKRYRGYVDNSPYGVLVADKKGRFVEVNRAACKITGYDEEELLAMAIPDMVIPTEQTKALEHMENLCTGEVIQGEYAARPKDRSERYWSVSAVQLSDQELLGFVSDVTDRRRMEAELMKMEKLESLGVLAGGIAHDFNNILVAILGNVSLTASTLEKTHDVQPLLKEAEMACMRARDLTGQLLTFSKGGAPIIRPTGVVGLVKDTASFTLRGSHVKYELDIADERLSAQIDEGQISQVLNNLLVNATQAMPEGGKVTIALNKVDSDDAGVLPSTPHGYIMISVRDQGIGIPPEIIDRLFDPFFTTKKTGSGLGLATCYSIVRSHGGHIEVSSKQGQGAEFRVYIPACEPQEDIQEDNTPPELRGSGRILIIDDDPMVGKLVGSMLRRLGYTIEVAADSDQAFGFYRDAMDSDTPFSAVIVDLTLPGDLAGDAIMRTILEIDPDALGIVSSGYSENHIMARYEEYGFAACIAKPYKTSDIAELLQRVLATGVRQ